MSTGEDAAGHGQRPASRIVRIAAWAAPLGVSLVVLAAVWLAVPHEAWLPVPRPLPLAEVWQRPLARTTAWLGDVHAAALRRVPGDAAASAVAAAACWSALTAGLLARTLTTTALVPTAAAGLALVAASAPLFAWQAGSPLGGGPLSLLAAGVLWAATRRRPPARGRSAVLGPELLGLAAALAVTLAAITLGVDDAREALTRVRGDLGPPGLLLVLISAAGLRDGNGTIRRRVWLGAAVTGVAATPLPLHLHAALVLPWTWWMAGDGLAQLLAWRGRGARRWAVVGLIAWTALNVMRVPWGQQRQHAALARTWVDGVAALADERRPIVEDRSAGGRLAAALVRARRRGTIEPALVDPADARDAIRAGRAAVVVDAAGRDRLHWGGVALDELGPDRGGVALTRLLDALPRGTIVLAAVSRDAAATLTPADWQALGRIGLRSPDAGAPRPHVVAGVTRARVEALEAVGGDSVTIGLQPGDPLGRTGTRSPVDATMQAAAGHVQVLLRDRPFLDRPGMVLAFFTTRGDLLGWRGGATAAHLDGPILGSGAVVGHEAVAALPCVDVGATPVSLVPVSGTGTLGITWARRSTSVDLRPSTGRPAPSPRLVSAEGRDSDTRVTPLSGEAGVRLTSETGHPVGATLRHEEPLTATADAPARVCAAWPLPRRFDLRDGAIDLPLLPRFDPLYASGWHDLEAQAGGGYFRWMAGPRADLVLPLRAPHAMRVELDAQGVRPPAATDVVRLLVNGQAAGARPLHRTRGIYTWDVPAAALRTGLNILRLETTATVRPADLRRGADPRQLGMLVFGWRLQPGVASSGE